MVINLNQYINKYTNFTQVINRIFTRLGGYLILVIAFLIFQDVIRRYFLNDPTSWALDISRFILIYVVFLSLAPALEGGHHVSVDILKEMVTKKVQNILNLIVFLLIAVFGVVFFLKVGETTLDVIKDNRVFPVETRVPMKYVYIIAPIGMLQFILTSLSLFFQSLKLVKRKGTLNDNGGKTNA